MANRINNTLFYTLVLSVYAIFFSVQFLFNFDGPEPGNSRNIFNYSTSLLHSGKRESYMKTRSSHSPSHTIRLNKRFHQENMTPWTVLNVDAPRQYVIRRILEHHRDVFLPSFFPVHHPLRGPPVAA